MAVLTIPNTFTAGTPALASEVNANFAQIVSWSTGLDQDNMATFTGDLAFTIANGNAISIQNNGNDESIKVTQGALLGASKASILITDSLAQTASGAAELKMTLASGATVPAIHITHGLADTFKLTRTALNVSSAVTTTLGGPLVLSNSAVTGPINLSGNLTVTGKEIINRTSTNQFLELANTTTSKSLTVTPQTSSFDLNINDTASAYNFKIDGVTKTVIDNNGLDGAYLKTASVPLSAISGSTKITGVSLNTTYSRSSGTHGIAPTNGVVTNTIYSGTLSGVTNTDTVCFSIRSTDINNYISTTTIFDTDDPSRAPGGDDSSCTLYSYIQIKINGVVKAYLSASGGGFSAVNASTSDNYQTDSENIRGPILCTVPSGITGTITITIEGVTEIASANGHAIATLSYGIVNKSMDIFVVK